MIEWTNGVLGSQSEKPKEIETEISKYYVYLRKNIRPYQQLDEDDNVIFDGWKYDEAKVLNDDYTAEKVAQLETANIQMQKDIEQLKEDNLTLMLALTDLYELQLGV